MKAVHRAEEEPVPYSALLEVAPLLEDESEPSENENQPKKTLLRAMLAAGRFLLLALVLAAFAFCAFGTCTAPRNAIEAENCRAGIPSSQWYVSGTGSTNIQGFTTDISVNAGQTISFKVSTTAIAYGIQIYRLGCYQGLGARFITAISPSATLPQIQPSCLTDSSTGLVDCGNWAVSASWTVPSTATSGIYFAKLVRTDTGEASPILFIVRNDSSHSDILAQTSDLNWHAYNDYGGNSLYSGNPVGRAYQVSYNRPVASSTSVTITASYGSLNRTATLTVNPPPVAPSITTQPASQSVKTGQTATFSVTASGTAPLSYQWQKNGVAIGGATSASYTTPATTAADNGVQFIVVVTNSVGSATSKPATLTVTDPPPPIPTVASLTLNPTSVVGGTQSSSGTVTLSAPAPAGGAQVLLSSNNGAARVPASVTVPAGAISATFTVNTSVVLVATSATISATYNNTTRTATLSRLL